MLPCEHLCRYRFPQKTDTETDEMIKPGALLLAGAVGSSVSGEGWSLQGQTQFEGHSFLCKNKEPVCTPNGFWGLDRLGDPGQNVTPRLGTDAAVETSSLCEIPGVTTTQGHTLVPSNNRNVSPPPSWRPGVRGPGVPGRALSTGSREGPSRLFQLRGSQASLGW